MLLLWRRVTEALQKHERFFEGICMCMTVTYLVSIVKYFLLNWETAGWVLSFFDCVYRNGDFLNQIGKHTERLEREGKNWTVFFLLGQCGLLTSIQYEVTSYFVPVCICDHAVEKEKNQWTRSETWFTDNFEKVSPAKNPT